MYSSKSSRQLLAATGNPSVDKAANDLLHAMQQISEDSDGEGDDDGSLTSYEARRWSMRRGPTSMPGLPDVTSTPNGRRFGRTPKARRPDSQCNSLPSLPRINNVNNVSVASRGDRQRGVLQSGVQQDVAPYSREHILGGRASKHGVHSDHGVDHSHHSHSSQARCGSSERKLGDELQALKLVHTKTVEELAQATRQLAYAQSDFQQHKVEVEQECESRMSKLARDFQNQKDELSRLKNELTQTRAEKDQHRSELQRLKTQRTPRDEIEVELAQMRRDFKLQKEELEDLRSELTRTKSKKEKLKSELQSMKDHNITVVEASESFFHEAQAKLQRQDEELAKIASELSEAKAEKVEHERQIEELRLEVNKAKSSARVNDDQLAEKCKEFEVTCENLRHKHNLLIKINEEQGAASATRQKELQTNIDELRAQLADKDAQVKYANQLHERLKDDLAGNSPHGQSRKKFVFLTKEDASEANTVRVQEELEVLKSQLCEKNWEIQKMEDEQEKVVNNYAGYINRIINSSAAPTLNHTLDTSGGEIIGMGHYGYVMTCFSKETKEKVVLKLQSVRWLHVAVREWAHGSGIGKHRNIVEAREALVHCDVDHSIQARLIAGFESGALTGKRPKWFPNAYLCMVQEYMDRGPISSFIEKHLLTVEGVCAVTRQVSSALAFMHQKKRTHNDVKPENILLKRAGDGNHLLVKLADMGLAEHSVDRARDHDMFAYTIWCMVLGKVFGRCPQKDARAEAMGEFQRAPMLGRKATARGSALIEALDGLWNDKLDAAQVACLPELEGCEVRDPDCDEMKRQLRDCAHDELHNRANVALQRFRYVARKAASLQKSGHLSIQIPGDEEVSEPMLT